MSDRRAHDTPRRCSVNEGGLRDQLCTICCHSHAPLLTHVGGPAAVMITSGLSQLGIRHVSASYSAYSTRTMYDVALHEWVTC
jgi:hypothetical protein